MASEHNEAAIDLGLGCQGVCSMQHPCVTYLSYMSYMSFRGKRDKNAFCVTEPADMCSPQVTGVHMGQNDP